MASTGGSDLGAASLSVDIAGSLSLTLMNLLMPVFSMSLARHFTPNYVTPLLEMAVAAIRPDLENLSASIGPGPSLRLVKV